MQTAIVTLLNRQKIYLIFLITVLLILYALPTQIEPTNFMQDDCYFYLQVAGNIISGYGSTFHKITPTNGYHPLWMFFSILGLFIAGGEKVLGLRIIFAIQAAMVLGIAIYFFKIAKSISLRFSTVGLAILAAYFFGTSIYGLEAHLNGLLLTAGIYYFLLAFTTDKLGQWICTGILLGLAILARLDNIFIVASMVCFGIVSHQDLGGEKLFKRFLALAVPVSAVILPYLIYNFLSYGHFVPISGSIKSTFPEFTANINNLGTWGKLASLFGILSLVLAFRFKSHKARRALLGSLGFGVLLHASYVVLFTDEFTFWPWYYVSGILAMSFVTGLFSELIAFRLENIASRRIVNRLAILFSVLLVIIGITRSWAKAFSINAIGSLRLPYELSQTSRWPVEVGMLLKDNLPAEAGILVWNYPGAIAFYSDLRVLPVDGLMNDYRYNDDLLAIGIEEYLCLKNVDYFLGPIVSGKNGIQEFEVFTPLYREPAGKIRLLEKNIVIRVRDIVNSPQETPPLAIWAIEKNCTFHDQLSWTDPLLPTRLCATFNCQGSSLAPMNY
jgi:hypothetical protein